MRIHPRIRLPLTLVAAVLLSQCADPSSLASSEAVAESPPVVARPAMNSQGADAVRVPITGGQIRARYHDLALGKADGFVVLNGCERRGEEGPVGIAFVHMDRVTDGGIDPAHPDALTYETTWIPTSAGFSRNTVFSGRIAETLEMQVERRIDGQLADLGRQLWLTCI